MLHVVATIQLEPGVRPRVLELIEANLPHVLAERGCRGYTPVIDTDAGLPAQGALRPDTIVIIEAWDDLDCLRAHLAAPHMAAYRERVKGLVRAVELRVLKPACG